MTSNSEKKVPAFGYEILRDQLIPAILGKHEKDILYWAGKDLARKYPCGDINLIITFFKDAGWGELILKKESKDGYVFHLTNDPDLLHINNRTFRLEAGFIAEQVQGFIGYLTECHEEKKEKQNIVEFFVKWDLKEKI